MLLCQLHYVWQEDFYHLKVVSIFRWVQFYGHFCYFYFWLVDDSIIFWTCHYICGVTWDTLNYLKKLCSYNITKQKLIFNDSSDYIFWAKIFYTVILENVLSVDMKNSWNRPKSPRFTVHKADTKGRTIWFLGGGPRLFLKKNVCFQISVKKNICWKLVHKKIIC